MSAAERLYTPELLSLTIRLAEFPLRPELSIHGQARSKSCGSTLSLGLDLDQDETIADLGMRVQACAIGQAAAALFADAAKGMDAQAIGDSFAEIRDWLEGDGPLPEWPGLAALEGAHGYKGRHGAMILPWEAALDALSSERPSG